MLEITGGKCVYTVQLIIHYFLNMICAVKESVNALLHFLKCIKVILNYRNLLRKAGENGWM